MRSVHMTDVDTELLVALDVVLTTGSVHAAASRLGTCPAVIRHRVHRLRELFDDPLLLVGSKGLVATPCAVSMASHLHARLDRSARVGRDCPDACARTLGHGPEVPGFFLEPCPGDDATTGRFQCQSVSVSAHGSLPPAHDSRGKALPATPAQTPRGAPASAHRHVPAPVQPSPRSPVRSTSRRCANGVTAAVREDATTGRFQCASATPQAQRCAAVPGDVRATGHRAMEMSSAVARGPVSVNIAEPRTSKREVPVESPPPEAARFALTLAGGRRHIVSALESCELPLGTYPSPWEFLSRHSAPLVLLGTALLMLWVVTRAL